MLAAAKSAIDDGRITPEELDRNLMAQLQVCAPTTPLQAPLMLLPL